MTFRPVGSGAAMLALALVLGACSATDPSDRAGLWHPRGVNNGNLAAMISNPQDLVRGRGVSYVSGQGEGVA